MTRRTLTMLLAGVAAYKAVEHLFVHDVSVWPVVGAPLLIGALMTQHRPRVGLAIIASSSLVVNLTPAYRNHVHLLMVLAATLALFGDEDTERWVLRSQLSIMYGFAAVAKLQGEWLSGGMLEGMTWPGKLLPAGVLIAMAVGTIVLELALAIGAWMRRREWFWLAVATHVTFLLFTQTGMWDAARLAMFGVMTVAVWMRASASFESGVVGGDVETGEREDEQGCAIASPTVVPVDGSRL